MQKALKTMLNIHGSKYIYRINMHNHTIYRHLENVVHSFAFLNLHQTLRVVLDDLEGTLVSRIWWLSGNLHLYLPEKESHRKYTASPFIATSIPPPISPRGPMDKASAS